MKNSKIIVLLLCLILPVFIAGCDCRLIKNFPTLVAQSKYEDADNYVIGEKTYKDVKEINVDWILGDINIIQVNNTDTVAITESGELEDAKKVHTYFSDGILSVKFWESGLKSFVKASDKSLTLVIPTLDKLNIKMTSGQIISEDIVLNGDFELSMTSGEIKVNTIVSQNFNLKMTSGDIELTSIKANDVDIQLTSGDVEISDIEANNVNVKFTSGDVDISQISAKDCNVKMTSGDLDLGFNYAEKINIEGTSGSYDVKLPENATLIVDKVTGSFKSKRDGNFVDNKYIFGSGLCYVKIKYTTGSLVIR